MPCSDWPWTPSCDGWPVSKRSSWLHLKAAGLDLLLSILDIREVIPAAPTAPLPGRTRGIGGVVIYQGEFLPVLSWEDLPGTGRVSGSTVALAVLRPRLGLPIERLLGTLDELPGTWSSVTEAHPAGAWLQGLCHGEGQVWQVIDPDRLVALLRQYRGER